MIDGKVNVLIVDDSAIVRDLVEKYLSRHPQIRVTGTAPDAYIARRKIVNEEVDVIVLDIEMPRMDGLTFLKHLMRSYPKPVVILSSLAKNQEDLVYEALRLGAVDVVPKPGGPYSVGDVIDSLAEKILAASCSSVARIGENIRLPAPKKRTFSRFVGTRKLLCIGASTGGTIALEHLFRDFPEAFPPTLAVIHMPEGFTRTFADRLNTVTPVKVKEAVNNEIVTQGCVYIAPGNYHMTMKASGIDNVIKITKGPKINNHRPSIDVLFRSVAENMGRNSCGILLTGMGKDGAEGLMKIRDSGGYTIAQDESTSIVFGMPAEAIRLGAARSVLPLGQITSHIVDNFLKSPE